MKITKTIGYVSSLITVIGRTGLVLLGMQTAFLNMGLINSTALISDMLIIWAVFICYGAIFTRQIQRLFGSAEQKIISLFQQPQNEAEELETKPDISLKLFKGIGWSIGLITAGVECVATYLGWGTVLSFCKVPEVVAMPVALTFGGVSVIGWTALVGFPTSMVFGSLFDKLRGKKAETETVDNGLLCNLTGGAIAFFTALGAGSVAFFVIKSALQQTRFATNIWPCFVLSPFVVIASGSLFLSRIPTEINNIKLLPNAIKETVTNPNKTIINKTLGTTVMGLTAGATYLLSDSSVSSLFDSLEISGVASDVAKYAISGCMAFSSGAISGREGYKFLQSPSTFFGGQKPRVSSELNIQSKDDLMAIIETAIGSEQKESQRLIRK